MTQNPGDETIQKNPLNQSKTENQDKEKIGKKPNGKDEDDIEYKPAKHPHEYINPSAEEGEDRSNLQDIEGSWDKKNEISYPDEQRKDTVSEKNKFEL